MCNTYIVLLSVHFQLFYCCQQLALFIVRKVAHSAVNTTRADHYNSPELHRLLLT